ncbi:MAG: hypothetical protein ACI97P_002341 [Arcticibacterium sp.]|jgi:hypothetical protein
MALARVNDNPRTKKDTELFTNGGLINGGKKAKKKSATFGFRLFVRIPEIKILIALVLCVASCSNSIYFCSVVANA